MEWMDSPGNNPCIRHAQTCERKFPLLGGSLSLIVFKDPFNSKFYKQFSLLSIGLWFTLGSIANKGWDEAYLPRLYWKVHFQGHQWEGKRDVIQERGKSIFKVLPYRAGHIFTRNTAGAWLGRMSSREAGQKHHASLHSDGR